MSILEHLKQSFRSILPQLGLDPQQDPLISPTKDPKFGDYQCNLAMPAAKILSRPPREIAQEIQTLIEPLLQDQLDEISIAGPGFLNLRLKNKALSHKIDHFNLDTSCSTNKPQTYVIDYSSPNIAKTLHVGHIRSTIIGDSICRILDFLGHQTIRQNHLGDWGTQFGMLCAHLEETLQDEQAEISDLESFYRQAHSKFKEDATFSEKARNKVVQLHQKDPQTLKLWNKVVEISRSHYQPVYQRLGILLNREDEKGESYYNDKIEPVLSELKERFHTPIEERNQKEPTQLWVTHDDGALVVFHFNQKGEPLYLNSDKEPLPYLIQKSDGAYLYSSTDLAAAHHRILELKADHVIYCTDARQKLHFQMLFATLQGSGWLEHQDRPTTELEHITFGAILGDDKKPLKTRDGSNVALEALLDEGYQKAYQIVESNEQDPSKKQGLSQEEMEQIAHRLSIGSIKYADLSQGRQNDYVFSWNKLLSFEGNTAPYLIYAYARFQRILRKADFHQEKPILLETPQERQLALHILRFPEAIAAVQNSWKLHLLADYLYQLSQYLMQFYEHCPILGQEQDLKESRLTLCYKGAQTLKRGLELLGIQTVERM